jgi:hypothetical protein
MTLCRWIATLTLVAVYAANGYAQTDQGKVSGTVRDQTNAFVAGAKVTVKNERTGEERNVLSNDQGYFLIGYLKPSMYTIKTEKAGFSAIEYTAMPLAVGQELTLDFEVKPAGIQEEVTVVGTSPVLDMSSARMGVNLSQREVDNLPVNGRQMSQLLLQAPGSQNAGTGTWSDIRFSGRAVEQNAIRYDGIEGSAIIDASPGNLNGEVATPFKLQASLENIQEFRVESSAYPAEYGTGSGGQVSVITKSGSNSVHGAAFEYLRRDKLDAPNYFDSTRNPDGSVIQSLGKSLLKQDQFGGSVGGPIAHDRTFFFGSFERYRLNAGINLVEAVPSAAAWARAVPAIAALRSNFLAPGAVILDGKSSSPDFDIAQLQAPQIVTETAASGRFDFRIRTNWSSYVRVFHDQGRSDAPDSVSGRLVHTQADPSNAVFNLQGILSDRTTNEFKLGYNAAPTRINAALPSGGADLSASTINLNGSVANFGIAGQGASSGITIPGGLVRSNSAQNGRGQPYDPYTLSFIDSLSSLRGNHFIKTGGEIRMIRMETDRLGGTTYTFQNVTAFLANQPSQIQFLGDESAPSVFNNGATGPRHIEQEYYIGYLQDEWHANRALTLNFGVRYDYYTPIGERNNLQVKFNPETGVIDPPTTPVMKSTKTNFQPRFGATLLATDKTIVRGGFGLFVGPGQTEDQVQTIADSDRVSVTLSSGANLAYPLDPSLATSTFINNPNNRSYQPRAYRNEYEIPERIWQYTGSIQRDLGGRMVATAAYVGSQGRNLFLRSIANPIVQVVTNPANPATAALVVRRFSIVQRDASGAVIGVQNPYAEIDTKTSGGTDDYNALQLGLSRRSAMGLSVNAQYTLSRSFGNTSGSNEAQTAANAAQTLAEFDYDLGYNAFDVRHTFNFSALYSIPFGTGRKYMNSGIAGSILGGWDVGGIVNARSGLPIDVKITRPDIVYVDGAGNVFNNPAAGRSAIINTPNGGASRNVRRPDLVPGVDPFVTSGGLLFLNPAAFATPAPGTFGNLQRGSLHGPRFAQVDLVIAKHFALNGPRNAEFRIEVFNVFDRTNFTNPVATLPNALPTAALTEANRVQPGQPFTAASAGTFGTLTSTVGRTVGLGTNRQVQLAFRVNF